MGMSVSSGANSTSQPMADINVTPLIDVMLVLLIIFMINAPQLTYKVQIDLPQPTTVSKPPEDFDKITVRINDDGSVLWNDLSMSMNQIKGMMDQAAMQNPQPQIMISAGDRSRYQVLARVMTLAKNAKITKIGFDNTQR
jgi:biopolymer transport protein ExbD